MGGMVAHSRQFILVQSDQGILICRLDALATHDVDPGLCDCCKPRERSPFCVRGKFGWKIRRFTAVKCIDLLSEVGPRVEVPVPRYCAVKMGVSACHPVDVVEQIDVM